MSKKDESDRLVDLLVHENDRDYAGQLIKSPCPLCGANLFHFTAGGGDGWWSACKDKNRCHYINFYHYSNFYAYYINGMWIDNQNRSPEITKELLEMERDDDEERKEYIRRLAEILVFA